MGDIAEIEQEISNKQSEKDALDDKIQLLEKMLVNIENPQYILMQSEGFNSEDDTLLRIYNTLYNNDDASGKTLDASTGYIETLYVKKIEQEKERFTSIHTELVEYLEKVNNEIDRANDLYDEWKSASSALESEIKDLKKQL